MKIRERQPKKEVRENDEYLFMAEIRALKYIIQYPDKAHHLSRPSLYPHPEASILLNSINYLREKGLTVTPESVSQEANKRESKLQFTLIKNLLFSGEESYSEADRVHILNELEATELKNKLTNQLKDVLVRADTSGVPDANYFEILNRDISMLQNTALSDYNATLITIDKALDKYSEVLKERASGGVHNSGDMLLDKALVRKVAGGQIILVAAATGSGKSMYVLNLANGFIEYGVPAIYITLEMDLESTIDRLLSLRLEIPMEDWYNPDKISLLQKRVDKEKERFKEDILTSACKLEIVDDPSISLADINSIISEFRAKHRLPLEKPVVIIVDLITQVQDFASGNSGYSMASNYEIAVNHLNVIAKAQNACFICTAQVNREADSMTIEVAEDIQKTRPGLNHVKNSHALAERSRAVLALWRPKYYMDRYLPDDPTTDIMEDLLEVTVLKQTQGKVGTRLSYIFKGDTSTIIPQLNVEGHDGLLTEEEQAELNNSAF